jgi:hypothetical protein
VLRHAFNRHPGKRLDWRCIEMNVLEQTRRDLATLQREFHEVHDNGVRAFEAGDMEAANRAILRGCALVERLGEVLDVMVGALADHQDSD